jgi:hypothetical protein
MHHKQIKALIRKQLKKAYPDWKRLSRKQKKALTKQVSQAVVEAYDFQQTITTPPEALLGVEEQMPVEGIMTLEEMQAFVETFPPRPSDTLGSSSRSGRYLYERELRRVHDLLDDRILTTSWPMTGIRPRCGNSFQPRSFGRNCSRPSNIRKSATENTVSANTWGVNGRKTAFSWDCLSIPRIILTIPNSATFGPTYALSRW